MNRRLFFMLAATCLVLGGCTMTPEYSRPEAPIPDQWPEGRAYQEIELTVDAPAAAELDWRLFFIDEHLQDIIVTALHNNRDLRLAALNVERTRALYGVQRAELLPAANAIGAGARQGRSVDLINPAESRTVEQYSLDLGIASWEIDFFGRIRSLEEQALKEYLATEEARRSAQITLVSEVARVYLNLAADRERLELARSTYEAQQESFGLIRKQYTVGLATELDLSRVQTQVEIARGDIARFTQTAAQNRNALNLLAGFPIPEGLLPDGLTAIHPAGGFFTGLSSEALLNRPDIMAAEYRLKGAYAFIGAARAAFFPRVSLTTSVGTASDDLSGLFGSGSGTWSFAPRITIPIFDARTHAAYRVSKAQRDIALAHYEKTIQSAFREVADVLAIQGTIGQQLSAQQSLTDAAEKTHRLSNERYLKGIDSYLGVLDAQRSLYAAQQGLISLRLTKLANEIHLYAVLGGGGKEEAAKFHDSP
jgi:outer membrane protein, multidrug efflux system